MALIKEIKNKMRNVYVNSQKLSFTGSNHQNKEVKII